MDFGTCCLCFSQECQHKIEGLKTQLSERDGEIGRLRTKHAVQQERHSRELRESEGRLEGKESAMRDEQRRSEEMVRYRIRQVNSRLLLLSDRVQRQRDGTPHAADTLSRGADSVCERQGGGAQEMPRRFCAAMQAVLSRPIRRR